MLCFFQTSDVYRNPWKQSILVVYSNCSCTLDSTRLCCDQLCYCDFYGPRTLSQRYLISFPHLPFFIKRSIQLVFRGFLVDVSDGLEPNDVIANVQTTAYKNVLINDINVRMKWCTTCQFYRYLDFSEQKLTTQNSSISISKILIFFVFFFLNVLKRIQCFLSGLLIFNI